MKPKKQYTEDDLRNPERFVIVTAAGADSLFVGCMPGNVVPYTDLFKWWRDLEVIYTHDVYQAYKGVVRATLIVTASKLYYADPDVAPFVVAEFLRE